MIIFVEKGYNALPGVIAQDITTWGEMKQVLKQLDDPEVKDMFKSIIVDTADIASQLCEKYICNQLGIENIGDGGWTTNGWAKVKKEWEQTFRNITMKGYAVVFISHSKERTTTRKDGTSYNSIGPSCSNAYNEIIKNMADVEGYIDVDNGVRTLILRSSDGSIECKSRFAKIAPEIPFSYESLVKAMNDAIDAEAADTGNEFITNERDNIAEAPTYDYHALREEFNNVVGELMNKNSTYYTPLITSIVDKYLGKGKKVSDATPEQAEFISLILMEIKQDLMSN